MADSIVVLNLPGDSVVVSDRIVVRDLRTRMQIIRGFIANSSVVDAKQKVLNVLRITARHIVYKYAEKYSIYDFDSVLTEQRHRDKLQAILDSAQTRVAAIQAATTIDELLVIFDQIENKR